MKRLTGIQGAAARALSRARGAAQTDGLTALERAAPVDAPSTNDLVLDASRVGHVLPALTERQLITTADVHDVTDVERCQAIVSLDASSWDVRCAITRDAAAIEEVARIGQSLREGVGLEEVQTA